jgi:hypothetical protein
VKRFEGDPRQKKFRLEDGLKPEEITALWTELIEPVDEPIGADWFQYYDQPTHGRDDGENFGQFSGARGKYLGFERRSTKHCRDGPPAKLFGTGRFKRATRSHFPLRSRLTAAWIEWSGKVFALPTAGRAVAKRFTLLCAATNLFPWLQNLMLRSLSTTIFKRCARAA